MADSQLAQHLQTQAGPHDDLKAVDKLSQNALGQPKVAESPEANNTSDDLIAGSLGIGDGTVCRSVPMKDLLKYLFLAKELTDSRAREHERERNHFHSQQLRKELGLDDLTTSAQSIPVIDKTALVTQSIILKQLEHLKISLEDWETVTKSAGIADLLRATRALKALDLGLPIHATEKQIEEKLIANREDHELERKLNHGLEQSHLVEKASQVLHDIRNNPAAYTSRENRGSVKLWTENINLSTAVTRELSSPSGNLLLTFASCSSLFVGSLTAWHIACSSASLELRVVAGSILSILTSAVGAYMGIGLAVVTHQFIAAPLARRNLVAKITNTPSMQKVIKELEVMGVQCNIRLTPGDGEGPELEVELLLPKKQ